VGLASLFVDLGALPTDCDGGTAVALVRRDELDTAVTVAMVVPVHKSRYPFASLRLAGERTAGVIQSILTAPRDCVYKVWYSNSD
jgi:hypothetical protein